MSESPAAEGYETIPQGTGQREAEGEEDSGLERVEYH